MNDSVLIVGVGPGLSASLARLCASKSMKIVLAARNIEKLEDLINETNADAYACDSSNIESVENLFKEMDKKIGNRILLFIIPQHVSKVA